MNKSEYDRILKIMLSEYCIIENDEKDTMLQFFEMYVKKIIKKNEGYENLKYYTFYDADGHYHGQLYHINLINDNEYDKVVKVKDILKSKIVKL